MSVRGPAEAVQVRVGAPHSVCHEDPARCCCGNSRLSLIPQESGEPQHCPTLSRLNTQLMRQPFCPIRLSKQLCELPILLCTRSTARGTHPSGVQKRDAAMGFVMVDPPSACPAHGASSGPTACCFSAEGGVGDPVTSRFELYLQ